MSRILVAEDDPDLAGEIRSLLIAAGHRVELTSSACEALAAVEREAPEAVVTDLQTLDLRGVELVECVRERFPALPVILVTEGDREELAALAADKGASSYVPKRLLRQELAGTVTDVLAVAQTQREQERVRASWSRTEFHFVLENDVAVIPPVIAYLEETLTRMRLYDQAGMIRVSVALREALINAMHHGNLGVSSELRESNDVEYHMLVESRRRDPTYRERRVHLSACISPQQAEFTIRDDGAGFDPSVLPDPRDPSNLEKVSGRGLFLIHTFMDEVRHNHNGTEITLIKHAGEREAGERV